jgi:hypothetical protein
MSVIGGCYDSLIGRVFKVACNLDGIFDELRAEFASATIIHNEYFAVAVNNFGDCVLVRGVPRKARCELPKGEPVVVFNENLKDLVENSIWIKRHFVLNPSPR